MANHPFSRVISDQKERKQTPRPKAVAPADPNRTLFGYLRVESHDPGRQCDRSERDTNIGADGSLPSAPMFKQIVCPSLPLPVRVKRKRGGGGFLLFDRVGNPTPISAAYGTPIG